MGKLYRTYEVKEVFDNCLNEMVSQAAENEELTGLALGNTIERIRILRKFVSEVIAVMEDADIAYEKEMAAWRLKQEEKKNESST